MSVHHAPSARLEHNRPAKASARPATHRTALWSANKPGKGGKRQLDGSSHKYMGDLCTSYAGAEPYCDAGDPNYSDEYDEEGSSSLWTGQLWLADDEPYCIDDFYVNVGDAAGARTSSLSLGSLSEWDSTNDDDHDDPDDHDLSTQQEDMPQAEQHPTQPEAQRQYTNRSLGPTLKLLANDVKNLLRFFGGGRTGGRACLNITKSKSKLVDNKVAEIEATVRAIYRNHRPEKEKNVRQLMQMYEGNEAHLLEQVREKYCPQVAQEAQREHKGDEDGGQENEGQEQDEHTEGVDVDLYRPGNRRSGSKSNSSDQKVLRYTPSLPLAPSVATDKSSEDSTNNTTYFDVHKASMHTNIPAPISLAPSWFASAHPTNWTIAGDELYEHGCVRAELQRIYERHRPEKYQRIGHLLQVYRGRERELLRQVQLKYEPYVLGSGGLYV